jgi:hydrogenase/urease accessory protein HupE
VVDPGLRPAARRRRVSPACAAATAWAAALGATPAGAHGIGADASDKSALEFLPLGIEHMLLGWDHLLFVAGVVLLAWDAKRAAKLISAFAAGHSLTLIVATLAGWRVNPTAIDAVIGLSVLFVAIVGLLGRPTRWGWFAGAVFGFGLLHGVGLSTRLQDLGLPEDGLLPKVVAFNVGIEIGQLAAVAVMALLGRLTVALLRRRRVQLGVFAVLGAIGAAAAATFAGLAAIDIMDGEPKVPVASDTQSCTVGDRTTRFTLGGGHPPKTFYEPGDTIPSMDFGHVIGDGFIVVTYSPFLPAPELEQLRAFVNEPHKVVGGPVPGQPEPVRAVHAYSQLTCTQFDVGAVRTFVADWFADPRSRSAE